MSGDHAASIWKVIRHMLDILPRSFTSSLTTTTEQQRYNYTWDLQTGANSCSDITTTSPGRRKQTALWTRWCRRINHQTLSENYICCYEWLCCSRALRTATGWLSTLQFPYWDGVRFDPVRLHVVRQTSSCLPEETHRKAYEVHINSTRSLLYTVSADNWTTSTRQGKNVRM